MVEFWQIKNAHTDNTEAGVQEQEEECNEYYHQIEMAIKHGRNPDDVSKPDVDCEVNWTCYIQKNQNHYLFVEKTMILTH